MSTTNHADFEALCAAFSLGALDGADREKLRAHLPTCSACRQRVAEFEESSSWLALGLAPIQPSDKVKTAVMQRISGPHGQARPGTGRAPTGPSGPSAGGPGGGGASALVYVALAVAGLALAGAAAVGYLYSQVTRQVEHVLSERDALASERDALTTKLTVVEASAQAAAREHREERARLLAMIDKKTSELENAKAELASADLQLQRLALIEKLLRDMNTEIYKNSERTPLLAQGAGRALWNGQDVVVIADLPPLPLGKTYELWRIEPGAAPKSAGLYSDLDPTGGLLATHSLPQAPRKVDAFAISREDTGGAVNGPTEVLMVITP